MQSLVTVVALLLLLLLLPQIRFTAQSYLSQVPPIHRQEECKVSPHYLNTKSILLRIPPTLVPTDTEPPRGRHCLANHNRTRAQSPDARLSVQDPSCPSLLDFDLDSLLLDSQEPPSNPTHSLYTASCITRHSPLLRVTHDHPHQPCMDLAPNFPAL